MTTGYTGLAWSVKLIFFRNKLGKLFKIITFLIAHFLKLNKYIYIFYAMYSTCAYNNVILKLYV